MMREEKPSFQRTLKWWDCQYRRKTGIGRWMLCYELLVLIYVNNMHSQYSSNIQSNIHTRIARIAITWPRHIEMHQYCNCEHNIFGNIPMSFISPWRNNISVTAKSVVKVVSKRCLAPPIRDMHHFENPPSQLRPVLEVARVALWLILSLEHGSSQHLTHSRRIGERT